MLGQLLREEGIKFVSGRSISASGSLTSRISSFVKDEETRVLFLNSLKQSTGLTLTQANHVFLMDPVDEANEEQAIGRSWRFGQLKNTHIYRYYAHTEAGEKRDGSEVLEV